MTPKQEIDKNALFRKIMPSAATPPAASGAAEKDAPELAAAQPELAAAPAEPAAAQPKPTTASPEPAAEAHGREEGPGGAEDDGLGGFGLPADEAAHPPAAPGDAPRHEVMTGEMPPHPPAAGEPPPPAYVVEPEPPPAPRRPVDPDKVPEWAGEQAAAATAAPPAGPAVEPGSSSPAAAHAAGEIAGEAQAAARPGGIPPAPGAASPAPAAVPPPAAGPAPAQAVPGDIPHPVNLAELLITELYPRYRERLNGCPCRRCRDDARGIALNKVRPRYMASDRLDTGLLRDRELVTEAVGALMRALFIVKRRPRHTAEDLRELQKL